MHFRDFNAVAAELREDDKLRLDMVAGGELEGLLIGFPILGSPARVGELTIKIDSTSRRVTANDVNSVDLVQ